MLRFLLKSKIQHLKVTDKNLLTDCSITIDEELIQRADILEGELVQVINNNNGAQFETYVTKGEKGSGTVCLNGRTATLGEIGDELTVLSYAAMETVTARSFEAKKITVANNNCIINDRNNSRSREK
ncbi:MAG: aspartate 1-decarboxylase [candidate division WOR-3 bacterium]|nr:aspartate 1-decarboxylase [candidate division WOR-3 bacterium]